MILIFKSSTRLRHVRENLTSLGLTPGLKLRWDYDSRWVDPAVKRENASTDALLIFADSDASRFLPIRALAGCIHLPGPAPDRRSPPGLFWQQALSATPAVVHLQGR